MNSEQDQRLGLPSASGIPRVVYCPGSPSAEKQFPGEDASDVAREGAAIHYARETGDDSELDVVQKVISEKLGVLETEAVKAWLVHIGLPADSMPKMKVIREERFWIRSPLTLKIVASAKPDLVVITPDLRSALVIDLKTGFMESAPAEQNWQLRTQAVAIFEEFPSLERLRTAIAQHRFGSRYDYCDYNREQLKESLSQLLFYLKLSEDESAPRVPGSHCRYCRARANCPEANALTLIPVVTAKTFDKKKAEASVALLNNQQLATLFKSQPLVNAILDAVVDRLKKLPEQELSAVGLYLKKNNPNRKLRDVQLVYQLLKEQNLVGDEEFRSMCKIGITEVIDLITPRLKERLDLDTVEAAKQKAGELLSPAVVLEDKNPSLKPL